MCFITHKSITHRVVIHVELIIISNYCCVNTCFAQLFPHLTMLHSTKKKPPGGVALFGGADLFGEKETEEEAGKSPVSFALYFFQGVIFKILFWSDKVLIHRASSMCVNTYMNMYLYIYLYAIGALCRYIIIYIIFIVFFFFSVINEQLFALI